MLNHIQDTLDLMRVQYPDAGICIMGDMNKLDVSQLCRNNNLVQVVDKPTRGNSILDKIVTNFAQFYSTPLIETPIGMSDHSTVAWFPKSNHSIKHTNATITKTVRPIKDSGIRSFGSWISSHDWREVYEQNNSQDCTNAFYNTLNEQMDLHFPTRQVKHHVTDKPWISSKTKDLIKRRQEVFNHSRPPIWRFYRNKVQRSIANDKKNYYHDRVQRHKKSNPAEWYRQIRVMTTNNTSQAPIEPPAGTDPSDPKAVANSINDHFVSIGQHISSLNISGLPTYLPAPEVLPEIYPWEVNSKLSKIGRKKAGGPDGIPSKLIREFSVELSDPLCHI